MVDQCVYSCLVNNPHPERKANMTKGKKPVGRAQSKNPGQHARALATANKAVIPKPPPRRPNIQERISMIELARTHHTGRVPKGGRPLPGLVVPTPESRRTVRDFLSLVVGRNKSAERQSSLTTRGVCDPPLTVTLLDESQW